MSQKYRVGILGATGIVGQRFIQLLENHPQFEITALAASDRSQGKRFSEACVWRLGGDMPSAVSALTLQAPRPPLDCDLIFSSLPSEVAKESEAAFAAAGYPVITNSSAFRMEEDVPLLIPEVNPGQLTLVRSQQLRTGRHGGFIVANPNCSTIVLALALAPLHRTFGLEAVTATTLQAISGAGHPGVASLDITDNVLPFIDQEEEKMERETRKILGTMNGRGVEPAPFSVSAQCHRVNVLDGHTVAVRVKLSNKASIEEVATAFSNFTGLPQELRLRTAPKYPVIFRREKDRPQPRLDRDAGGGMSITVGRLVKDAVLDFRFVALGHNTIRGAAGAALLNAELLSAQGYFFSSRANTEASGHPKA